MLFNSTETKFELYIYRTNAILIYDNLKIKKIMVKSSVFI